MNELVGRLQADIRDEDAWDQLYLDNLAILNAIIRRYIDSCDREDVRQEVWLKVYGNISGFDNSRSFRPWFATIARNACIDWLKKKRGYSKRIALSSGERAALISFISIDDESQKSIGQLQCQDFSSGVVLRLALGQAVQELAAKEGGIGAGGLKARMIAVFMLYCCEGFSYDEISELTGEPVSTIHNWPGRINKELKPVLMKMFEMNAAFSPY
jgi:RNA polymerase sigma-70 factor, ECF subfamily